MAHQTIASKAARKPKRGGKPWEDDDPDNAETAAQDDDRAPDGDGDSANDDAPDEDDASPEDVAPTDGADDEGNGEAGGEGGRPSEMDTPSESGVGIDVTEDGEPMPEQAADHDDLGQLSPPTAGQDDSSDKPAPPATPAFDTASDDTGVEDDPADDEPAQPQPDDQPDMPDDGGDQSGDVESSPENAFATFAGDDGGEAWLDRDDSGDTVVLTGYIRSPDGQTEVYDDADEWAAVVDGQGMMRQDGEQQPSSDGDDTGDGFEMPSLFADFEAKHLQGQHNQETHGRRYSLRNGTRAAVRASRSTGGGSGRAGSRPRSPKGTSGPAESGDNRGDRKRRQRGKPAQDDGRAPLKVKPDPDAKRKPPKKKPDPPAKGKPLKVKPDPAAKPDRDPDDMSTWSRGDLMMELTTAHNAGDLERLDAIEAELESRPDDGDDKWGRVVSSASDEYPTAGSWWVESGDVFDALEPSEEERDAWEKNRMLSELAGEASGSRREVNRAAYDEWATLQTLRFEQEHGGEFFNRRFYRERAAGTAPDLSGPDMFNGRATRAQIRRYGSEELLRWFGESKANKHLNFQEWKSVVGAATDNEREAADQSMPYGLSEFEIGGTL